MQARRSAALPGSESCWIHALLCAVCHREGVSIWLDCPPGIPFIRRTVDMNDSKTSVRTLTMMALLVAMSIVFSRVLSISTGFVRFNLGSLPVLLAALLFGPWAGFAVGVVADMIGGVLAGYAINPLITLGAGAIGLVAGYAWQKLPNLRTGLRLQISVLLGHFVGSMVINSLALRIFYGYAWSVLLTRIPNAIVLAAVNTVLLRILLENRSLMKLAKK
ncbi:MAG: folate family ECF transporter S component [Faecalibacterium sp.]